MGLLDWASAALIGVALLFFIAGTLGLLRLPDPASRLHVLTKADNLGLLVLVLGLLASAPSLLYGTKLILVWASGASGGRKGPPDRQAEPVRRWGGAVVSHVLVVLDLLLCGTLVALALSALTSPEPRRGVILFIAFGLLLALVWARLRAPDVAIAEAAIGAGVAGALLLSASRRAERRRFPGGSNPDTRGGS